MDESQLIKQILDGNIGAFNYLVRLYQKLVLHVVRRMVADDQTAADICQDVFVKVYQKLGSFRQQSKLSTWIAQIAYNESVNYLRKRKQLNEISTEESKFVERQVAEVPFEASYEVPSDVKALLMQKIEQLPPQYKAVITLFYLEEFSINEIEEITQMPEGTIKSYLSRAKQLLRKSLTFVETEIRN